MIELAVSISLLLRIDVIFQYGHRKTSPW